MSPVHDERTFEDHIVSSLLERGWIQGDNEGYEADLGLDTAQLFRFIEATQNTKFKKLISLCGDNRDRARREFTTTLVKRINNEGTLDILRGEVTVYGVQFKLAYFKPSHTVAENALADYNQNRLSVTRQFRYATMSADRGRPSLDLALFVNGLPVATAELKNPLTGQNVNHAKRQYAEDRDPRELLFTKRTLVHFAVDPDLVFLTTRLEGEKTRFLPFNTGSEGAGHLGGAGNPLPAADQTGYRTAYLWEEVWEFDNWLDLLRRFVHTKRDKNSRGVKRESVIFPRYHQWHAVRSLVGHAARHGAGHNYLVMHSAGSGKSNTIAWLAHRLSSLHTPANPADMDPDAVTAGLEPDTAVFDKTFIITDRSVLDRQLQDTVGSFSQVKGVVKNIGGKGGSKSSQLAKALAASSERIIVVTLQTFPALIEYLREQPTDIKGNKFAIVVDEAHSSQSGEAAKDVKKILRDLGLDADDDSGDDRAPTTTEEALLRAAADRGRSANLSYFAFTATPKHKTLNLFGVFNKDTDKYEPFHTYSMRQAIEEGFILDPLRNYYTYKTWWELRNANDDDPEVERDKAKAALARLAETNEKALAEHAKVIIDNFQAVTAKQMGGRAKAMVVTRSREAALKLYRAIKRHVAESPVPDPGVLVAFSGSLKDEDEGKEVTEAWLNGFSERELPEKFAYTRADDRSAAARNTPEYRILVVADKYQTGFDQPLLTTMFVEKRLRDVAAVQTLSRLNRIHPLKSQSDLFVLDFVNDAEEIKESYKNYYEEALTGEADPDVLYSIRLRLMREADILVESEVEGFAEAYFSPEVSALSVEKKTVHPELNRFLDPAVERFTEIADSEDEDERSQAEEFRSNLNDYTTKYGFLSQVMDFPDANLHRLFEYARFLIKKLPGRRDGGVDIGKVEVVDVGVLKTGEHDLGLNPDGPQELPGFSDGTSTPSSLEKELLSAVIELFNEHFGRKPTAADMSMYKERLQEVMADDEVDQAAQANADEGAFRLVFDRKMKKAVLKRYHSNVEFTNHYAQDAVFKDAFNHLTGRAAHRLLRQRHATTSS